MTAIRLQRYIAQAGVAARRKAEELIRAGEVKVNGEVVTVLGSKVVPGRDRVTVAGKPVYPQELFYVVMNKPKGCITAVSDPEGRPTVMEYLHKVRVAIAPVGRLDFYSEGVLLLTNDGELSARLQAPRYHVEKTYHVKIRGRLSTTQLAALRDGVRLEDGTVTQPAQVDLLRGKSRHDWLVITLTEGKSRQIHRMLEAVGYPVLKLQRVAYGGITFHGLRVGDARELGQAEVNELRAMVGLPRTAAARGQWQSRREDTELGRRARARARAGTGKSSMQGPGERSADRVGVAARPVASRPRPGSQRPDTPRPDSPERRERAEPGRSTYKKGSRTGPARSPSHTGSRTGSNRPERDSRPGSGSSTSRGRGDRRVSRDRRSRQKPRG